MSSAQEAQMSPELQAKRDEYIKNKVQIQKDRREEKKGSPRKSRSSKGQYLLE
jgi:hypothetical protein